jgi:hypothetical protein
MSVMMYVPPYEALLRGLKTNKQAIEQANDVTIPVGLLKMLLQLAITQSEFDEKEYLRANPDVRLALRRGDVPSGRMHYIGYGYFEGRRGGAVKIDERQYLRDNPDVATAVKDGQIKSAEEHFYKIGAGEGRSPTPEQATDAAEWKKALHGM